MNVALIGYGFAGQTFHAPLIAATPGLVLHTVASSNRAKVLADFPDARVAASADEAFADPAVDLVVIATPNPLHAPQAHAALTAGKHVVVDKPFTVTVEEARAVIAHAEQAGRLLSVFQNRRWDGDFLTVRKLIGEGALGAVTQYESHFDRFRPVVRDRWREQDGPGGGAWFDLGPHVLDQALLLFGPPLAVRADIAAQRPGAVTDDYFHVVLRYPVLRVILHASMLTPDGGLRLAVHGDGGSFIKLGLDVQEDQLKAGLSPADPHWGHDETPARLTRVLGGEPVAESVTCERGDYPAFYAAVRDAILGKGANPVPPDQALRLMTLLDLCRRSAREGRELPVS